MSAKSQSLIIENQVVRLLEKRFGRRAPGLVEGIGDDAAVIRPNGAREHWVITTDMLLEGIDFQPGWLTPFELGHKALAVNLSDLAAMGASPRFYLVALGIPLSVSRRWIVSFYAGMSRLGDHHRAVLIGGDLSRSTSGVQITVTAVGETRDRRILRRSGGRPGDLLYVTGALGKAAAGLRLLRDGKVEGRTPQERDALRAQKTPEPRCAVGEWLAGSRLAHSMMDLSDGLSMDVPRMCAASGIGAELYAESLPIFAPAGHWGANPLELALHGGEDFELLFSVPAEAARRLKQAYPRHFPPITPIGRLTQRRGVVVMDGAEARPRKLVPLGFDHFRTCSSPGSD